MAEEPADKLGMTDEQWEWFQKATHGYGDQDENGIDLSLLRQNLKLTPTKRLEQQQGALRFFLEVRRVVQEPDVAALLMALDAASVQYVLIGGLAMVAHGCASVTQDLDLSYAPDEENRRALAEALAPYHPVLRAGPHPLPLVLNAALRAAPNLALCTDVGPVEVLGAVEGVRTFDDLWARSVPMNLYGTTVHVASLNDLIAVKRAVDRLHDRNHVMELQALRKLVQGRREG